MYTPWDGKERQVRPTSEVRQTDTKGRVVLGKAFANKHVIVRIEGPVAHVELAKVVPEREAWLHENPEAMRTVREGLKQASEGRLSKSPPKVVADPDDDED